VSKVAGFIIGALEIGIGIATSNPMLIAQGTMTIAMQAIVDLTAAKQPAREASEMAIKLSEQPRSMFVGEGYTPGSLVDGFNYGGHDLTDWECLLIRLADHPCEGLTGFFVNDEYIPYTGNGNYPHFDGHHFELYFRADTTAEPLPDVVLDHGPGWTAADQGKSGCDVLVCYFRDPPNAKKPAWPGGRPRFGFVLKGKRCYDPRKDDTVPGGVGPHRWDDPTTWEWSENAIVCWYNFERGVFANDDTSDPTKLLVGRGLTAEESPPEMIFAAANLCDEIAAAAHPAVQLPINGLYGAYFSPDRTLMVLAQNPGFEIWYLPTRSRVYGPTLRQVGSGPIAVNPDGSFYCGESGPAEAFTDGVSLVDPSGAISVLSAQKMEGGVWKVAAGIFGRWSLIDNNMLELTAGLVVPTAVGFQPSWYFDDQAGVSWAIGGVGTGVTSYTTGIDLSGYRRRTAGPIYAKPALSRRRAISMSRRCSKPRPRARSSPARDGRDRAGQAKSVVATFTDADLVVGSKVSWNQGFLSESSDEWLNTVVGTYVEPDQKWNSHSTPPRGSRRHRRRRQAARAQLRAAPGPLPPAGAAHRRDRPAARPAVGPRDRSRSGRASASSRTATGLQWQSTATSAARQDAPDRCLFDRREVAEHADAAPDRGTVYADDGTFPTTIRGRPDTAAADIGSPDASGTGR
jgi:hypothetical protein